MSATRNTLQQQAIRLALEAAQGPQSIAEILSVARCEVPSVGQRTVYRVVGRLVEEGELTPVDVPGQPARYELTQVASREHHHFHCDDCDRVFDVEARSWVPQRFVPEGFELRQAHLTLQGKCGECREVGA